MKFSIIWILAKQNKPNKKTLTSLGKEVAGLSEKPEILIYGEQQNKEEYEAELAGCDVCWLDKPGERDVECYNDARERVTGKYVTAVSGGDTFSSKAFLQLEKRCMEYPTQRIFMMQKIMPNELPGAFSSVREKEKISVLSLKKAITRYPFYFGGTWIEKDLFQSRSFRTELGIEAERDYFLRMDMEVMELVYCPSIVYYSDVFREGDVTFYEGIYDKGWYEESFDGFWIPFFEEILKSQKKIPKFLQYHFMFTVRNRLGSNRDNRNKHVVTEGKEIQVLESIGRALKYIDDSVICNTNEVLECGTRDAVKWIFGILKYGEGYCFEKCVEEGKPCYAMNGVVLNEISVLKTNVVFLDYEDGILHFDGAVHPILHSMAEEVYIEFDGKKYPLEYNGRYNLTKIFGVSLYKHHSFHVDFPMKDITDVKMYCVAVVGGEEIKVDFYYDSHFSRISGLFQHSYWNFGEQKQYMAVKEECSIRFKKTTRGQVVRQELGLDVEMFLTFTKKAWLFLAIRLAYFAVRPFMKKKVIWMYLDKIYKGGDSSEYLYRYASKQDNNIKHYYLIDKNTSDYKRLKADGFEPLVRGSIKHRLVFLMADMMVISNSTVFAFNGFGSPNASYMKDLVDFHVCCVQHGMSVQKIAVAQNRLRDNTRLYFCASKYEIENLSRPIYDYVGYDALKLTGVPRYDGLVNDDKKQIMISPTWRMQAAVPVRTSEGEQRDYNPLFKESTYYKVFNSLINDERLIAAAKKYGYRIKYVLHPIVSAQVKDFDKNDYVDIIPAVGDMSYERMFCESSLMVTDFSGIQFDFAYMRKPLVYLHHKDIPQHYEEGTFFYDTMAFGEIAHDNDELIDYLCEYMQNGCKMKEEYVRRADDFFYYSDRNNCERIYKEMLAYQEKHIN